MDNARIADCINQLGAFCGMRDIERLAPEDMERAYGFRQADVMVLFGGSVLQGADAFADAMRRGVARVCMIVGGEGHTTESLRQAIRREIPDIDTRGMTEADALSQYLRARHRLSVDLLERESTNCGNNVTNCLALLEKNGVRPSSLILIQDASMQRRMDAGFRKRAEGATLINHAAYRARVVPHDGDLAFETPILGMWDMDRYIQLLMGEIPRLTDDENGYGPNGKGFIARVDIPPEVQSAFETLKARFGDRVREANAAYATKPSL